jgi:hypothetical protein
MLHIRREQSEVLARAVAGRFTERAVDHVRRCWPRESASLGEDGLRNRVDKGIERAAIYGVRAERDVIRFIDLTFLLAPDFDTSSSAPFAREALTRPGLQPGVRVDLVWAQAKAMLAARRPRK